MKTLRSGEPFEHRVISLHKRIDKHGAPSTYWFMLTLPWKQTMYNITMDEFQRVHPRASIGFRFFYGPST